MADRPAEVGRIRGTSGAIHRAPAHRGLAREKSAGGLLWLRGSAVRATLAHREDLLALPGAGDGDGEKEKGELQFRHVLGNETKIKIMAIHLNLVPQ